jgi:hypothetical protein
VAALRSGLGIKNLSLWIVITMHCPHSTSRGSRSHIPRRHAALEMQQATLPVVLKLDLDKKLKDALVVQNDLAKRASDSAKR